LRPLVVVERHAGGEDVDEGETLVGQARLEDRHQLGLVAREGAGHEAGPQLERQRDGIDGAELVGLAALALGPHVGRGGELPLGEAVDAVVLDDVQHVQVAADGVNELSDADRERVAVARDADVGERAVGGVGAGGDRRHAAVRRVEAVGPADEVGRRLRRAANAGELGDHVRRRRELVERADDRRGDRVVAAAGAEGRGRPFVVADGQPQLVGAQVRVDDGRFQGGHYLCSSWLVIPSMTCRLESGKPP
jgi:hypothetical protein